MAFEQFNQTLTGTRKSGGAYVNGVWTPSVIRSSVQPSSDKELKLLPEGRREDGAYTLRSKSEILEGDVFDIYGEDHEVTKRQVWQNGVIPHYLGIATKVQP